MESLQEPQIPDQQINNENIDEKFLKLKTETEEYLKKSKNTETKSTSTLRKLVSQDKNRFCFDGFDLDLSYITPKIIAMGIPSTAFQGLFRNKMEDVKAFFNSRHKEHYIIYNLCEEKKYPDDIFYKQGYYPFKDHEAPPLNLILPFCQNAKEFLDQDPNNVIAVHCKAGKGRTGTLISCLLLYLGVFDNAADCLRYYGIMRVSNFKGVTVPSQIRYVHYFERVLKQKMPHPIVFPQVRIKKIRMITIPSFSSVGSHCSPDFTIENGDEREFKWSDKNKKQTYQENTPYVDFLMEGEGFTVKGDVRIKFVHLHSLGKKDTMFKLWFNTCFIPEDGVYVFTKDMIDKACKDLSCKKFKKNFKIEVHCIFD